jgi:hypothetical protein
MIYQTIFIQEVSPELTYLSHDKIADLNPLEAWKFINYINPHRGRYIHQYRIWIWYNHWLEIRYPPHVSTICWLDIPTNLLVESTISISHEHLDLQIIFNILQLFSSEKTSRSWIISPLITVDLGKSNDPRTVMQLLQMVVGAWALQTCCVGRKSEVV